MLKLTKTVNLTTAMIISMIIWGMSWPSNKVLTSFGSPVSLGILRYTLVITSLFCLLILLKVKLTVSKRGIPFILISGIMMASYNYTFLAGLKNGSPGAGGILVTTLNPILAYSIGILLAKRKPKAKETIGILLGACAGVVLLRLWDNVNILKNTGNVLFLASAVIWSVMSKFSSRSNEFGNPFAFTFWMYVVTLLFMLPVADYPELNNLVHCVEPMFWGNLLFASVVVTSFATTMYFYATSQIGAERASSFIFTVPLCAGLSSFFILNEQLHWYTILGGLLGIAAVYVLNRKNRKEG